MSVTTRSKLMIVEDNIALNDVLTEFLNVAGYNIDSFFSSNEIDSLRGYDIAVLDLNLPGEDGLSIASRIKAVSPATGIILLTIRSDLEDKLKGYETGADVFMPKPVDPSELLAVIKALLRRVAINKSTALTDIRRPTATSLSGREIVIIKLIAQGLSYNEISSQLSVSLSTVQSHIRTLYAKLGAHSKMQAIRLAKDRAIL
jgi:DNA-binding NarL/FixJ family response regulator